MLSGFLARCLVVESLVRALSIIAIEKARQVLVE